MTRKVGGRYGVQVSTLKLLATASAGSRTTWTGDRAVQHDGARPKTQTSCSSRAMTSAGCNEHQYHEGLACRRNAQHVDRIGKEGAKFMTSYYAEQSCTAGRTNAFNSRRHAAAARWHDLAGNSRKPVLPLRTGMHLHSPSSCSTLAATGGFGKNHLGITPRSLPRPPHGVPGIDWRLSLSPSMRCSR